MAILNFPPTAGEPIDGSFTYTSDGVTYSWDGYKWTADTGSGGGGDANHSDGPTPPTTGELADQWYNTDDGRLYTYTADSSGALVWIDASPDSIAGGSGGSGDGTTVNYNGASAWGNIKADGTLAGGHNCKVSLASEGQYSVEFLTPMPNANYSIVQATQSVLNRSSYVNVTTDGFTIKVSPLSSPSSLESTNNSFAVFAENAIAPQSGVGADAWGTFSATTGDLQAGMNIKSITRTSVGDYNVEFITEMPSDLEYAVTAAANSSQAKYISIRNKSTSGFRVVTRDGSENISDASVSFTVHASSTVTPTYTWTRDGTQLKTANDDDDVNVGGLDFGATTTANGVYLASNGSVYAQREDGNNNSVFASWKGTDQTCIISADGTASFAGQVTGRYFTSDMGGSGVPGNFTSFVAKDVNDTQTVKIYADGHAIFNGAVTAPNVTFNLEPDNSANYVSTMVDGEETQVYSGPTLDVKALLLTLQTAATRIATLEAKVATLESDHTTLMNNNNNGGGY